MNKLTYEYTEYLLGLALDQMNVDGFEPELIVGISRGGLLPAVTLSHYLNVPMLPLRFSTRDWVQQDSDTSIIEAVKSGSKVLIVDDIVDSGTTLSGLTAHLNEMAGEDLPWGYTIKLLTLQQRHDAKGSADYVGEILKDGEWQEYPWEGWKHD